MKEHHLLDREGSKNSSPEGTTANLHFLLPAYTQAAGLP